MGVIYKITSPSGKIYIGKTYNFKKRMTWHKYATRKGSKIILHNSIRKYGWDSHQVEIIEEVDNSILNEREIYWIKELNTCCHNNPMGMNMTIGGEGQSGGKWKPELKKWFSEKFKGENGSFYGRKHTEGAKKIIAEKASKRNKERGISVPKWGAEKGRLNVIKAVLCYDKKGNFIAEFESVIEAATKLYVNRSSITESCKGIITGVEGKYVFRFKEPNFPLQIEVGEIKKKGEKRPVVLMNEDFEEIAEFSSSEEASDFTGVPKTTINRAAQYNYCKPIRTGHVFVYKDNYDIWFKEAI